MGSDFDFLRSRKPGVSPSQHAYEGSRSPCIVSDDFVITTDPHFLWITEFPLFTQADSDKDFLAKGRWSSTHHPFTAPMWQDIDAMYRGDVESVSVTAFV